MNNKGIVAKDISTGEKLINYDRLNDLMAKWQTFIDEEKLDLDEQKLFFDILRDRREQTLNKMRASDMAMSMPFGALFNKVAKFQTDKEEKY